MNEQSQVYAATVVGSLLGAVAGYLFFTDAGRTLRRRIEPSLEEFVREILQFRSTVNRARGIANEGWRLIDELGSESSRQQRPF